MNCFYSIYRPDYFLYIYILCDGFFLIDKLKRVKDKNKKTSEQYLEPQKKVFSFRFLINLHRFLKVYLLPLLNYVLL